MSILNNIMGKHVLISMKNGVSLEGFAYSLDDTQEFIRIVEHNNEVVFARVSEISVFRLTRSKPEPELRQAQVQVQRPAVSPMPPPRFQEQQDDQISDEERAAIMRMMNIVNPKDNLSMERGADVRAPKLERKT